MVEAGRVRLVVLGLFPGTTSALSDRLARVRGVEDLDGLAAELPGSCHLVLSVDGRVRVQGAVSGLRRVFHARHGRGTVASDRADVLAALTGAPPDEDWLALGMLRFLPHPLADRRTPWRGVHGCPPTPRCSGIPRDVPEYVGGGHRRSRPGQWPKARRCWTRN